MRDTPFLLKNDFVPDFISNDDPWEGERSTADLYREASLQDVTEDSGGGEEVGPEVFEASQDVRLASLSTPDDRNVISHNVIIVLESQLPRKTVN